MSCLRRYFTTARIAPYPKLLVEIPWFYPLLVTIFNQYKTMNVCRKSNFRQYGQMEEKQRWEESEMRREEERRSEERKSEKKEDAGARKDRKVASHCVFPMICGSGESKSRLAKAAGAEPSGQMR